MPNYTFRNKDTHEEITLTMKIAELEQYLLENPHMKQLLSAPRQGDSVLLGVTKTPDSFKDLMKMKKKAHRHSTIDY